MYGYTTFCLSLYQLIDIWVGSTFWWFQIMLLWTFVYQLLHGHMLSLLLDIYLGAELPGPVVTISLTLWGTTKQYSKVAVSFYNPTSKVWEFQFPHILVIICPIDFSHQVDVKWYFTAVLIWLSLMANDVGHLLMCLLAIYISFSKTCLFRSFAHFSTELFVFLL